jgi:hypothetical protein
VYLSAGWEERSRAEVFPLGGGGLREQSLGAAVETCRDCVPKGLPLLKEEPLFIFLMQVMVPSHPEPMAELKEPV